MLLSRQATDERDEHIDMTPMVDVVFQLMTFLLFSMQMTTGEAVDVPPARHGVGVDEDSSTFLTVLRPSTPGEPGPVLRGNGAGAKKGYNKTSGAAFDLTDALATDEEVEAFVREGLAEGRRRVVIQADGEAPHGQVLRLAAAASRVEGITVHLGVQEPQER